MPQHGGTDRAREHEDWASYLVRNRLARGKRPIDLVDAAKARGKKLSTGQITNWEKRRNPASPESALLIAEIFENDPVEALRAAGHDDWADYIETERVGAPKPERGTDEEFIAKLRSSSDPEMHKLADRFEQDLQTARRMARFELEELQRQREQAEPGSSDVNSSVNKSA